MTIYVTMGWVLSVPKNSENQSEIRRKFEKT